MIKILHCADAHLDAPFALSGVSGSELRRRELRESFRQMMRFVRDKQVDILLIAGDLFDGRNVKRETVEMVREEFAKSRGTRIFISPGNHDPYTDGSVWQTTEFSSNVVVFRDTALSHVAVRDLGVEVYGYAFQDTYLPYNPAATFHLSHPEYLNILCAHGDLTSPASRYCPITKQDIERSGLDYIALGHIHNGTQMEQLGKTRFAYSGCLEGRSFDECGYKSALLIEAEKSPDGEVQLHSQRVRFSQRRYERDTVDITGVETAEEICARIARTVQMKDYGEDTALRLILTGTVSPELTISPTELAAGEYGLFYLEVESRALPLYDERTLHEDRGIRGAFYGALAPLLQGSDADREMGLLALHYGLSALAGEDLKAGFQE